MEGMEGFSNKTVLVTGATGLIGSRLVESIMAMGDVRVVALSRSGEKLRERFGGYAGNDRLSYIAADVSDSPIIGAHGTVDYIFHAAGPMEAKAIAECPVGVIMPNLRGTANCLELLCRQKEITGKTGRLVLFSSVTVYANHTGEDRTVSEGETDMTEFLASAGAPYSQSKRMSEVIVQAFRKQYGVEAVIARLSTVYGYARFRPDTAFFQFIDTAIAHRDIIMNASGIGRRDNIYIDDAVDGLLRVCALGEDGQAYNISSNGEMGNYAAIDEIGQAIADDINKRAASGRRVSVVYKDGGKNPRKPGLKLDNSRLKGLGWEIRTSLVDGVHRTIDAVLNG